MLNKEKFANEIIDIASRGDVISFDAVNNKISACHITDCDICAFQRRGTVASCADNCLKWCNSEYVEPEIDRSKVPVDTPILVSDNEVDWQRRYFADYVNNTVYSYSCGATLWSSDGCKLPWKCVKLANEEDAKKYVK